jgi:hypothetical protein
MWREGIRILNPLCYGRRVSSFEREFNSAVEAVERDVFINLVCENPQLTLAELTKLGKGKFANLLSSVSVGDIIQGGRGGRIADEPELDEPPGKAKTNKAKGSKARAVNTRTPEGRKAYDSAVLAVVAESERPIKAPEITSRVGGTALQVRKSLARLIELGRITWEGKARGMRYSAAE